MRASVVELDGTLGDMKYFALQIDGIQDTQIGIQLKMPEHQYGRLVRNFKDDAQHHAKLKRMLEHIAKKNKRVKGGDRMTPIPTFYR